MLGIIGGVGILVCVVFGVIVVYMKRQNLRSIKITKTAVAKSNSYKSNVGCKLVLRKEIEPLKNRQISDDFANFRHKVAVNFR